MGILNMNFNQLIDQPTHKDGGIIDHLYLFKPQKYEEIAIKWELFSPFYSDHFGISIIIQRKEWSLLRMKSSFPEVSDDGSSTMDAHCRKKDGDRSHTGKRVPQLSPKTSKKVLRKK